MRTGEAIRAFLGLGSSMGDRLDNLRHAVHRLQEERTIRVVAVSSVYETPHLGVDGEEERYPPHLNAVVEIVTTLSPFELLDLNQEIENERLRQRYVRWGPRTLDIDILLYDALFIEHPRLVVPHTELQNRNFVLVPLDEIAPQYSLPDGTPIQLLLAQLREKRIRAGGQDLMTLYAPPDSLM